MNEIKHPIPGQIWEKNGQRREIIIVKIRSSHKDDCDVIWRRPDTKKEYTIWLPYWNRWSKKAHLMPF